MNIQIFGTRKCFETKKAERYFRERRIPFQKIDLLDKGMSRGELLSVCRAAGGLDALLNPKAADQETLLLLSYLPEADRVEKLLENQHLIRTPVVRNGKLSTVGFQPEVWKDWT